MPVEIAQDEMPAFVRSGTVTKYADLFNYLADWLKKQAAIKDADKRKAVIFNAEDGIAADTWGAIASGIRRVAKDMKYKVQLIYREDTDEEKGLEGPRLYCKFGGDFVALTPEQVAQRKAKRRTNKIAALTEKYEAEGMTKANAAKRAKDEVDALKVV